MENRELTQITDPLGLAQNYLKQQNDLAGKIGDGLLDRLENTVRDVEVENELR